MRRQLPGIAQPYRQQIHKNRKDSAGQRLPVRDDVSATATSFGSDRNIYKALDLHE